MVIIDMKLHFRERAIEWWSASMLCLWGAYVLLHPEMFTTLPSCQGMLLLAPQHIWGFLALVFGMVRLSALTINGFWYRTPLIRLATAFLSIFVWFWVEVGMILAGIPQMGLIIYGWLTVADMYSAFRSAADTYEAEAQRRLKLLARSKAPEVREASNVRNISGN
jgi:hypothetical protein